MKALRIILKEKYWGKAIGIHVRNHVKNRQVVTSIGRLRSKLNASLIAVRDAGAWVGVSAGLGAVAASATGDRKMFGPMMLGALGGASIEHINHIRDIRKKLKANDKRRI